LHYAAFEELPDGAFFKRQLELRQLILGSKFHF